MKNIKRSVLAGALAATALASGAVAVANIPQRAPVKTVAAVVDPNAVVPPAAGSDTRVDVDEERARLEKEIAKSQRALDRLKDLSLVVEAIETSSDTVGGQSANSRIEPSRGDISGGDSISKPGPEPSADTWTGASGNEPGTGYGDDDAGEHEDGDYKDEDDHYGDEDDHYGDDYEDEDEGGDD